MTKGAPSPRIYLAHFQDGVIERTKGGIVLLASVSQQDKGSVAMDHDPITAARPNAVIKPFSCSSTELTAETRLSPPKSWLHPINDPQEVHKYTSAVQQLWII